MVMELIPPSISTAEHRVRLCDPTTGLLSIAHNGDLRFLQGARESSRELVSSVPPSRAPFGQGKLEPGTSS